MTIHHRSAITGEYVTAEHAAAHPDTTVAEEAAHRTVTPEQREELRLLIEEVSNEGEAHWRGMQAVPDWECFTDRALDILGIGVETNGEQAHHWADNLRPDRPRGDRVSEPLDLDAIKARANAATPGPWDAYRPREVYRLYEVCSTTPSGMNEVLAEVSGYNASNDAEFIAAARTDIPDLLAAVERLSRWKREALPVLDGLQELGRALDLPLGTRITGTEALAAVERLTAERDVLAETVERVRELHRESRGAMSALYPMPICECGQDYPCATVRALGGES